MSQVEPLPYGYNALEPFIDEQTMRIHHDKHYQTYLDKYTTAIENFPELKAKKVEEVLSDLKKIPLEIKTAVINHGGGYANHRFFWQVLRKEIKCDGEILAELNRTFGSYDKFKEEFSKAALGLFGSGWTWLVYDVKKNKVEIITTANQDCP
ncbi:MAG: superoxide dismutase, partial [Nanoarchaeota archaeon]